MEFKQKIRKLRAVRADLSIASDCIVGFPGEGDADFERTMKLIEDVGFDQSCSFIYSRRPGTPAADLEDTTSEADKHARLSRLQAAINDNAARISAAMVGSVQRVLVERTSKRHDSGLHRQNENITYGNIPRHPRFTRQFTHEKRRGRKREAPPISIWE